MGESVTASLHVPDLGESIEQFTDRGIIFDAMSSQELNILYPTIDAQLSCKDLANFLRLAEFPNQRLEMKFEDAPVDGHVPQ